MRKRSHITVVEGESATTDAHPDTASEALLLDDESFAYDAEEWEEFEPRIKY